MGDKRGGQTGTFNFIGCPCLLDCLFLPIYELQENVPFVPPTARVPLLPRYYQGAMTSCRSFRRASFPSLGETTRSARVSPTRGRALPRTGLLELVTRYLRPGKGQWKRQDLLRSWGTPILLLPCSPTPAGPTHQAITMRRRGPRCVQDEGSRIRTFEAQSHGFGTGCLRFAGRVAPTPRKTRFRLLA